MMGMEGPKVPGDLIRAARKRGYKEVVHSVWE